VAIVTTLAADEGVPCMFRPLVEPAYRLRAGARDYVCLSGKQTAPEIPRSAHPPSMRN
jgi:hypothetical protein